MKRIVGDATRSIKPQVKTHQAIHVDGVILSTPTEWSSNGSATRLFVVRRSSKWASLQREPSTTVSTPTPTSHLQANLAPRAPYRYSSHTRTQLLGLDTFRSPARGRARNPSTGLRSNVPDSAPTLGSWLTACAWRAESVGNVVTRGKRHGTLPASMAAPRVPPAPFEASLPSQTPARMYVPIRLQPQSRPVRPPKAKPVHAWRSLDTLAGLATTPLLVPSRLIE